MLYSVIFLGKIQDSHWGVEIYRPQDELWYPYGWSIVSTTLSSKEPLSPPSSTPSSTPSPSSQLASPPSSTSSSSTCAAHPPPVAASSSTSLLVHHLSVFFLFYLLCLVSTSGSSSYCCQMANGKCSKIYACNLIFVVVVFTRGVQHFIQIFCYNRFIHMFKICKRI